MPRTVDATAMANNWQTGIQGAGGRWTGGINNPRQDPNANPANMTANYLSGTAAAGPAYTAKVSSPTFVSDWKAGAAAKVASFTGSGAARKAKAQAAFTTLAPRIVAAMSGLPPKGRKGTNGQRSIAFGNALRTAYGKA